MTKRPLGMSILSGIFGILGIACLISGISSLGGSSISSESRESVHFFLTIAPLFLVCLGILGVCVAIGLWVSHPWGPYGGISFLGLWLISEVLILLWGLNGPTGVQEYTSISGTLVRILIGGAIIYYLLTTSRDYVSTQPTNSKL